MEAFGVWRLAFGVWRLAFGVWRLAFGVWRVWACGRVRRVMSAGCEQRWCSVCSCGRVAS